MKTSTQLETEAIAASKYLGYAVFFAKGIKNNKAHYRIYQQTLKGGARLVKETGSAYALAAFLKKKVAAVPKASTHAPFKTARKNPATRRDEADAVFLATQFHGRPPAEDEYRKVDFPEWPDTMAAIGSMFAVEYIAERDGKEYRFRHVFAARSRPALVVSPDGKLVTMLGGAWHFTQDGFEDLKP